MSDGRRLPKLTKQSSFLAYTAWRFFSSLVFDTVAHSALISSAKIAITTQVGLATDEGV